MPAAGASRKTETISLTVCLNLNVIEAEFSIPLAEPGFLEDVFFGSVLVRDARGFVLEGEIARVETPPFPVMFQEFSRSVQVFVITPVWGGWYIGTVYESEEGIDATRRSVFLEVLEPLPAIFGFEVLYRADGVDKIPLSE